MNRSTLGVTSKALVARINRRLKRDDEVLRTSRSVRDRLDLGQHYVLDWRRNFCVGTHVDVEALGRELEVLHAHEQVVS